MADNAEVRSLDQLETFLHQTEKFRTQLSAEIENLSLELRRLTNWLTNDVHSYWSDELVKSQRRLSECRDVLSRCMSYVREDERRPCTEEKKRFRLAEERNALCQQKLKTVQAAIAFWEMERSKQHAKVARCRDLAESDMQVACNVLRDQVERLQSYAGLRAAASTQPIIAESILTGNAKVDTEERKGRTR